MRHTRIAVAVLILALAIPVAASAQDWVMDWHSTGNVAGFPFHWDITGTSSASLVPVSGGLPPAFATQAFDLRFTSGGRTFGGTVALGTFQDDNFVVPAPAPLNSFGPTFSSGDFSVTGNTFSLSAFVGLGHNNAEIVATGTRTAPPGPTASAAEPGVMLIGGAGLIAAAGLRRRLRR